MTTSSLILLAAVAIIVVAYLLKRPNKTSEEVKTSAATVSPSKANVSETPVEVVIAAAIAASTNQDEIVAAITAAIGAMGYSASQIASVRPARVNKWILEGRLNGRM